MLAFHVGGLGWVHNTTYIYLFISFSGTRQLDKKCLKVIQKQEKKGSLFVHSYEKRDKIIIDFPPIWYFCLGMQVSKPV